MRGNRNIQVLPSLVQNNFIAQPMGKGFSKSFQKSEEKEIEIVYKNNKRTNNKKQVGEEDWGEQNMF